MSEHQATNISSIRSSTSAGGRTNRDVQRRLRAALLGTVAAGAMVFGYGRRAYAQVIDLPTDLGGACTVIDPQTITCTGDVANGILLDNAAGPYSTLNVNGIDGHIIPGAGTSGIRFTSDGDVTVVSDTGDHSTFVFNAHGIEAVSNGGAVTIDHQGDIVVEGNLAADGFYDGYRGISASATDSTIEINNVGDITTIWRGDTSGAVRIRQHGIYANGDGSSISITNTGDITTSVGAPDSSETRSYGIWANTLGGSDITVRQYGNIYGPRGVLATAYEGGDVDVRVTGDVITNDTSFQVYSRNGDGDVSVYLYGNASNLSDPDVPGRSAGVIIAQVKHDSNGDLKVHVEGDLTNYDEGTGITARTYYGGYVDVYQRGDIVTGDSVTGFEHGIAAESGFRITSAAQAQDRYDDGWRLGTRVVHIGDITTGGASTTENEGIRAESAGGHVTVEQTGNIRTYGGRSEGIRAYTLHRAYNADNNSWAGGDITVTQIGSITTDGLNSHGVFARAKSGGDVSVTADSEIYVMGDDSDGLRIVIDDDGDAFVRTEGSIYASRYGIAVETLDTLADGDPPTASLEVAGLVSGGSGVAVDLTQVFGLDEIGDTQGADIRFEIQPGYGFDGLVDARNEDTTTAIERGDNRLVFGGPAGEATFDLSEISPDTVEDVDEVFFGFANVFLKEDESNFLFTGAIQDGAEYESASITGGLAVLQSDATLRMAAGATPFTVEAGGLGATGLGGVLEGDVEVWEPGAIVLSNSGPFDSVDGLAATGDVLNIAGDFHSDSGSFYLDTYLDDGSSQDTDMLVIDGSASGTTVVYVTDTGGPGGVTGSGATDGILIVDVGTPSDGVFELGSRVTAGAFEYGLFEADGEDWYLQTSNLADQGVINPFMPYSLRTFGREVTGNYTERSNSRVGWGPGASNTASHVSAADLPTDDVDINDPVEEASSRTGLWARLLGAWSDADGTLSASSGAATLLNDVSYDESLWAIQSGFDAVVKEGDGGTLVASAFMHYGQIDTDSDNTLTGLSAGSTDTDGWGGGAGLTFTGAGGLYLDGLVTYTHYEMDVTAASGDTGSTDGYGWTVSGEAGWRFDLGNRLAVTPQVQLLYQDISIDGYTDSAGVAVSFSDADSLEGRIGGSLEYAMAAAGGTTRLYVEGNLVNEFLDDPVAVVAGTPLALGFDGTGYTVGVGARFGQDGGGLTAWVEGDYRAPFGSGMETWSADAGIGFRF